MISAQKLKIPQHVYDYAYNKVITSQDVHTITPKYYTYTEREKVPRPKLEQFFPKIYKWQYTKVETLKFVHQLDNSLFGAGMLNFIAYYTLGGYEYVEARSTDTRWVFSHPSSLNELVIVVEGDNAKIFNVNNEEEVTYSLPKTNTSTKETVQIERTVDAGELAEEVGITYDEVKAVFATINDKKGYVKKSVAQASENHLAHAFSVLSLSEGVVSGDLLINGKSWTEFSRFGDIVFPFGKAGMDIDIDWVLYNEHATPENPNWLSEGNGGESARVRITDKTDPRAFSVNVATTDGEGYYDSDTHTFYYNPSKQAILSIAPMLEPAQGKNDDYECCIDLNSGKAYWSRGQAFKEAVKPQV